MADETTTPTATDEDPRVWMVEMRREGGVEITFAGELADAPYSDEQKLHALGRSLINLGTRLLSSAVDEDDYEDDD